MVAGDVVNTARACRRRRRRTGSSSARRRTARRGIDRLPRGRDPVEAKGKAEPVPVWEACRRAARAVVELARRRDAARRARARARAACRHVRARPRRALEPQLVTLVGVPGIGKSRLVAELFGEIVERGRADLLAPGPVAPLRRGRCRSGRSPRWSRPRPASSRPTPPRTRSGSSLMPWPLWFRTTARRGSSRGSVLSSASLRPRGGDDRAQSFAAWRRFVEALAEQRPTVLVFEDLHWADDDLLDFVDELVDWATDVPLLVVATARPELLDRRPGWGGGKRNALDALARAARGRRHRAADRRAARPHRAAGGDAAGAARPRRRQPALRRAVRAHVRRARRMAGELPETVQGIIAARLDSLPAEEKRLLLDAAVFGKTFWVGALQAEDAEARLHALQRKEFVRRERRSSVAGEAEYLFTHLLVRDVAYAQIPRADARRSTCSPRAGSSLSPGTGLRISPSCSRTTTSPRSSSRAPPAAIRPSSSSPLSQRWSTRPSEQPPSSPSPRLRDLRRRRSSLRLIAAFSGRARSTGSRPPSTTSGRAARTHGPRRPRRRSARWATSRRRLRPRCSPLSLLAARPRRRRGRRVRTRLVARARCAAFARKGLRARRAFATAHAARPLPGGDRAGPRGACARRGAGPVRLQIAGLVSVGTALTALGEGGVPGTRARDRAWPGRRGTGVKPSAPTTTSPRRCSPAAAYADAVKFYAEGRAEVERFGLLLGIRWLTPQEAWAACLLGDWRRT